MHALHASFALLVGCTPIMPASSVPVNNISLHQSFIVGCEHEANPAAESAGGEALAVTGVSTSRAEGAAVASESLAAAAPGSVAISNDVWVAGTRAAAESSAANTVTPTVSAAVSAAGTGNPSTSQVPAAPAAPTSPEHE